VSKVTFAKALAFLVAITWPATFTNSIVASELALNLTFNSFATGLGKIDKPFKACWASKEAHTPNEKLVVEL